MNTNLKKLLPLLGVVCLSTTHGFADDYSLSSADTCAKIKSAVPPGVNCPCDDGPNVYVNVAYTLWTARQEGLASGYSNTAFAPVVGNDSTIDKQPLPNGKVLYPSWKLRSGFKVGLGAYLDHDCWDVGIEYAWFWNKNNSFSGISSTIETTKAGGASTANGGVAPLWQSAATFGGSALTQWNTINCKWNNWFNRIHTQLGRSVYVGHYLSLRPFIGLIGAWEEQNCEIEAVALPTPGFGMMVDGNTGHQDWWSVGPYMGFNTAFIFTNDSCNEWSLFMDSGFALPWGHYETTYKQNWSASTSQTRTVEIDKALVESTTSHFWNIGPMIELSLGLRWETTWSECNEWSFLLQAAWESQVWFAHNQIPTWNVGNGGGNNYGMHGLTLKAQLDF